MAKSISISRQDMYDAYLQVRRNKGGAGIDGVCIDEFDADYKNYLYKLWNRMSSGSYFPPSVREVEIPKKDGSSRFLGVPTVSDRIAQTLIKNILEPRFEKIFSPHSYGFRPGVSAHNALASVRKSCWKMDFVIDLDIKSFFDTIDHELLIKALKRHVSEKWILMYIERWLQAPVQKLSGEQVQKNGMGTPQGGVISPLLANLFLHYAFDEWLVRYDNTVKFVRYADDVIVHCYNESHASTVLSAIRKRLLECGLTLHPDKTKIVYCKDSDRTLKYPNVSFDFLGFRFQPRRSCHLKTNRVFTGFDCAISPKAVKRMVSYFREFPFLNSSFKSIVGIASVLNPVIRGWINYYGKFRQYDMGRLFQILRARLIHYVRRRHKRYRGKMKAIRFLDRVRKQYPTLFYHWTVGF